MNFSGLILKECSSRLVSRCFPPRAGDAVSCRCPVSVRALRGIGLYPSTNSNLRAAASARRAGDSGGQAIRSRSMSTLASRSKEIWRTSTNPLGLGISQILAVSVRCPNRQVKRPMISLSRVVSTSSNVPTPVDRPLRVQMTGQLHRRFAPVPRSYAETAPSFKAHFFVSVQRKERNTMTRSCAR